MRLLRILMTNACALNCHYCPMRRDRDMRRTLLKPEEDEDKDKAGGSSSSSGGSYHHGMSQKVSGRNRNKVFGGAR